jgi:cyclic pyranopterin phosphate synthase
MSGTLDQRPAVPDRLGRALGYLRVSVTDRCNFRCQYCMPREVFGPDFAFLPRSELLSFEEITRLVTLFAAEGVTKVRLTGGEPLLRRDLAQLVGMIAAVEGISDIALTTNGVLLPRHAGDLADAGLTRVTVSLDALDDTTFAAMNGVGFKVSAILAGIDAVAAAGLAPAKVNMVVERGVNDHAVLPMAEYFREHGNTLRFIEYMDVGTTNGWRLDKVVPSAEILATLEGRWSMEAVPAAYAGEVANRYRYRDGAAEIGLISSMTQPFCGACTRARLSADGILYTCLFAASGHDLRGALRGGADDATLRGMLRSTWSARADRYSEPEARRCRPGSGPDRRPGL